jgi:hypothetical protein
MRVATKLCLALLALAACGGAARAQQTVTLVSPAEGKARGYARQSAESCFSFERGTFGGRGAGARQELCYGMLSINHEDWLKLGSGEDDRSVIRDLGALAWADSFAVPALAPLPELKPGERRQVVIDASGEGAQSRRPQPPQQPAAGEGDRRHDTHDAPQAGGYKPGDGHKLWAQTTQVFAKAVVGHVYAVRVVRAGADFYALFRVEAHEQGKSCTISWRLAPAPEPAGGRPR